jgi:hypothetical protein
VWWHGSAVTEGDTLASFISADEIIKITGALVKRTSDLM